MILSLFSVTSSEFKQAPNTLPQNAESHQSHITAHLGARRLWPISLESVRFPLGQLHSVEGQYIEFVAETGVHVIFTKKDAYIW